MNLFLISIIYLILGLFISYTISFYYLKHYPKKNVKFAFYSSVFIFGLIIFFIFLIPYDIAISVVLESETSNLSSTALKYYYLIFGYFSKVVVYVVAPILILINTTGFYKKCDITIDIIIRFIKLYISFIKVIVVVVLSIPTFVLFYKKEINFFEFLSDNLIYLNFFPYLKILFYIGFVCQDLVYSYIRRQPLYGIKYDIWKLGKIFKYYNREKLIVNERYKKITKEIEKAHNEYNIFLPEDFKEHFTLFKINVENTQRNLLVLNSEREKVYLATNKYKNEKIDELRQNNKYFGNDDKDNNNNEYTQSNMLEQMFNQAKIDENELKEEAGVDFEIIHGPLEEENEALMPGNDNLNNIQYSENNSQKSNLLKGNNKDKQFKNWKSFKNYVCDLMTEVNESSISVQRKSYLINTKGVEILSREAGQGKKKLKSEILILIIIFYIILFFYEIPWSLYDWFPVKFKENFFGNLFLYLFSIILYFFIFNYAVIYHRYMSGNFLFGKNHSESVNYYNFIIYVLGNCDAIFYHSVWVLGKNKKNGLATPQYFEVFELPQIKIHDLDIIPYISMFIIIISIFNSTKFSNLKIRKKEIVLFNENADFFYNENNLYSNFILGCGVLIFIKKNLDNIIKKWIN